VPRADARLDIRVQALQYMSEAIRKSNILRRKMLLLLWRFVFRGQFFFAIEILLERKGKEHLNLLDKVCMLCIYCIYRYIQKDEWILFWLWKPFYRAGRRRTV